MTAKQSLRRETLVACIRNHPGSTTKQIGDFLGVSSTRVAIACKEALSSAAPPIKREYVGQYNNGAPKYLYYVAEDTVLVSLPKPPAKVTKPAGSIDRAVTTLVDTLVASIADVVAQRLSAAVGAKVEQALAAIPERIQQSAVGTIHPPVQAVQKAKKTTFCVVGLLPAQAGMIQSEFGDVFEFHFVGSNGLTGRLRAAVGHSDRVLIMASFVSHASVELVKSAGGTPELVHGGMTRLREVLTQAHKLETQQQ